MPEAPPKKINADSFKRGLSLEEKVESNSEKITLVKNIISLRKDNVDLRLEEIEDDVDNIDSDLMDGLHSVVESLVGVKAILADQVKERIKQRKDARKENERLKKKRREDELEGEKKDGGGILKSVGGIAKNIFGNLKKFLTNVLLGAALIKLFEWLNNPETLENLKKFGKFLEDHGGKIAKLLLVLTALNLLGGLGTIVTIGKSIKGIIALLAANPVVAGVLGLGIATAIAGNWLIGKQIGGGKVIREGRKRVEEEFREKVIASNERLMSDSPDTPLLDANSGLLVYPKGHEKEGSPILTLNYYGNKGWKGKAGEYDDPTGKSTGQEKYIKPGIFKADGTTWGTNEQINLVFKKEKALDKIGAPGKGIQAEMWKKISEERKLIFRERDLTEEKKELFKNKDRVGLDAYKKETLRMQDEREKEIKEEYRGKLGVLVDEAFTGPLLTDKEMYDYHRSQSSGGFPMIEKYENSDTVDNINESIEIGGKEDTITKLKEQKKNLNLWQKMSGVGSEIDEKIHLLETGKEMDRGWNKSSNKNAKQNAKQNAKRTISSQKEVSGRFDVKTGKAYINNQEVSTDEYNKFYNLSKKEQLDQYGIDQNNNAKIDKSNKTSVKGSDRIESNVASNKSPKINLLPITGGQQSNLASSSGSSSNDSVVFSSEDPSGTGQSFAIAGIYNVSPS
tara:strand:- start:1289 stop:3328 length:2040 start_codon:yes stop_codon:yes gene_type:complete